MKIAYVAHWHGQEESGVLKKIVSQLQAWNEQGANARLFLLSPGARLWEGLTSIPVTHVQSGSAVQRFSRARRLVEQVVAWSPDVVYLRQGTYYPAIEQLMRVKPTVLEVNTDISAEDKAHRSLPRRIYNKVTSARILHLAEGFVFVTHELAARFENSGKPQVVIANGIDLSKYVPSSRQTATKPSLVFMGVGPLSNWHGVDKILWLASQIPDMQFDLIGIEPSQLSGKRPANVTPHGFLGSGQYEPIIRVATVGLGTLALHRNGMEVACALKVREYLAYGIPTIIGYRDVDFPDSSPNILQLPNTANNVVENVPAIREFVHDSLARRVPREAIAHIDSKVKERQRLDFLARVITR